MDILQAYIDIGVMMQKPNARTEKDLRQHYKVLVCLIMNDCMCVLSCGSSNVSLLLCGALHTHMCIQFVIMAYRRECILA